MLAGQEAPDAGTITFDGRNLTSAAPYERARAGLGYVPQGREIYPLLTVKENLQTGFAPLAREVLDNFFATLVARLAAHRIYFRSRRLGADLDHGPRGR